MFLLTTAITSLSRLKSPFLRNGFRHVSVQGHNSTTTSADAMTSKYKCLLLSEHTLAPRHAYLIALAKQCGLVLLPR